MTPIDPARLATAFVAADTPTLADVLRHVETSPTLSPTRRRDLASGLRRLARGIGVSLEEAVADPAWLRPRIAGVAPAALGISPKSWTNALSDAKAAMCAVGIVEGRASRPVPLTGAWRDLWAGLLASGEKLSLAPALGRFVRFLCRLGVAPEDVSDAHATAYRDALALNALRRAPDDSLRAATYGWNRAAERLPDWPRQRLAVPSRDTRFALPPEAFPAAFAEDLQRYLRGLTHPDPLDAAARIAPLRPATVRHRRAQVLRFASALVHAGVAIETLTGLDALVVPARVRQGLTWMLERSDGTPTPGTAEMAVMLTLVARDHVRAPEADTAEIARLARRLAVPATPGLTDRNRARLRPLQDPDVLRRLLRLPQEMAARARQSDRPHAAALSMEMAVALAILLTCPIRRTNLAELRLDRNLQRMRDGRVFLVYAPGEVKNRRPIEFELPPATVALISPFLFPRRDGLAAIEKSALSRRISKTIRQETGLEMHPHLFRHLAAMIWLEAHPGSYEAARRLLGHAALSSTLNAYAGFEAGSATRLFAGLIDAARRGTGA
jgi:integrase